MKKQEHELEQKEEKFNFRGMFRQQKLQLIRITHGIERREYVEEAPAAQLKTKETGEERRKVQAKMIETCLLVDT